MTNIICIYKYFFAVIIIVFVAWNRSFRKRGQVKPNFSLPIELIITSNFCFMIFFGCIMYINIKKVFNIKKQSLFVKTILESIIIQNIIYFVREYVLKAPEFFYKNLTKNIDLQPILETPGSYFTAYCKYPRIIVISFLKIPVILVATTFLIDNLFFGNLTHFFQSLVLLIPLLIMQLWLFMLESYSTRRLDHLIQFLVVTHDPKEKRYVVTLKPDNQLPILEDFTIPQIKNKFEVLCDFWEIYSKIYSFMKEIDFYRNLYNSYVQTYTCFCFFIGWSIQLFSKIYIYLC